MTAPQRLALLDMMDAILAVKHAPASIRARAEALEERISPIAGVSRRLRNRYR